MGCAIVTSTSMLVAIRISAGLTLTDRSLDKT
jgi:hypothetical protein